MVVISEILGAQDHPDMSSALHRLDHEGVVDRLVLSRTDLSRKRVRARTEGGHDVAIALPRDQALFDGAVLQLDDRAALVVHVEAEHWLRVSPVSSDAAIRLGYLAGNLHWRVRFDAEDLLVAIEGEVAPLLARLQPMMDLDEIACTIEEPLR